MAHKNPCEQSKSCTTTAPENGITFEVHNTVFFHNLILNPYTVSLWLEWLQCGFFLQEGQEALSLFVFFMWQQYDFTLWHLSSTLTALFLISSPPFFLPSTATSRYPLISVSWFHMFFLWLTVSTFYFCPLASRGLFRVD